MITFGWSTEIEVLLLLFSTWYGYEKIISFVGIFSHFDKKQFLPFLWHAFCDLKKQSIKSWAFYSLILMSSFIKWALPLAVPYQDTNSHFVQYGMLFRVPKILKTCQWFFFSNQMIDKYWLSFFLKNYGFS